MIDTKIVTQRRLKLIVEWSAVGQYLIMPYGIQIRHKLFKRRHIRLSYIYLSFHLRGLSKMSRTAVRVTVWGVRHGDADESNTHFGAMCSMKRWYIRAESASANR